MSEGPWPPHPDDEWVDVTILGAAERQRVLGFSGSASAVAQAREAYVAGSIDAEELEQRIGEALGS